MVDPILSDTFFTVIKFGLLAFLFLYIVFAGIVIKQVSVMTRTVKMGFEGFVKIVAVIHFIFAVAVFVFSLMML
jgi:hypothetical protein